MKTIISLSLVFMVAASTFTACKNYKEQRIVNKLEGNWKITNMVMPVGGKDSSFLGKGNWINLRFDECNEVNNPSCNMAFTISISEKKYQDVYFPVGYTVKAKNQLRMVWNKDTLNFKIDSYKKNKLKLVGMDADFANQNNYIIEGER